VPITFLSLHGRFRARATGRTSGNVLLRREQYRRTDLPDATAGIARSIVLAKIANSRATLQRTRRNRPDSPGALKLEKATLRLAHQLRELGEDLPLDRLRGFEGEAARVYFSVFDQLISQQKEDFRFQSRTRRPPRDNVNALLSFLYTLLRADCEAALESVGLDPAVGFLHRERPGRPSLALDLMEELRSFLADRVALSLVNQKQVTASGFKTAETGGVEMDDATRKTVLQAYQKRKQDELVHPFLEEKTTLGLVPHLQALLLARHLRGDLDAYPAFVPK
jgi:CRISPR-associated protein Cas1